MHQCLFWVFLGKKTVLKVLFSDPVKTHVIGIKLVCIILYIF
mgnify:CR=1 FL=1